MVGNVTRGFGERRITFGLVDDSNPDVGDVD